MLGWQLESNEAKPIFPLEITKQPTDATAGLGETAQFTVEVAPGRGPYTYCWYYSDNGGPYFEASDVVNMTGGSTATLTIPTVYNYYFDSNYRFYCLVIAADGQRIKTNVVKILKS